MTIRLIISYFLLSLALGSFGQSFSNLLSESDLHFENSSFEQAYAIIQSIGKQDQLRDSTGAGEHYLRLSDRAEQLEKFPEAIRYHMLGRHFLPFPNQKENQYYIDRVNQVLPPYDDSLTLSRLYYRYAVLLTKEQNQKKAFDYFFKALNLAKGLKNYAAVATIANDIAGEYWDAGHKELSTKLYQESLSAARALNDSNRMAAAYLNIADNYIEAGDFKNGIYDHLKALEIKEKISDKSNLSYYYISTAQVYHRMRSFEKWEEYIEKAYQIKDCDECTKPQVKVSLYAELGGIAKFHNDLEKAACYFDTSLQISNKLAYYIGQKIALDNLALIHKDLGDYEKALSLFTQSETFVTDNPFYLISHRNAKAELYLKLNSPAKALQLVEANSKMKVVNNYSFEKLRTWRILYKTHKALGNYRLAFQWNDSLQKLENQLRDEEVRKEMAALEAHYQTEKKVQQIQLLTTENELKNKREWQAWLAISFLLILVAFILFLLYFRHKQSAYKQSELRQQLLRSQMNPHFIFNVMGSIQSYLYKNEANKAADYLSKFAALSRSVLNFSSQEKISLNEEIDMLQNYIELERARMEKPFDVEFIIDNEMETDFIRIPPMLLQPFVENAIKHGLKNIDYQGKLTLSFKDEQEYIAVEIADNGLGVTDNPGNKHKSMAMGIFQQRKKCLERKFKKELIFEFQNLKDTDATKHGVRVYFQLPILNND